MSKLLGRARSRLHSQVGPGPLGQHGGRVNFVTSESSTVLKFCMENPHTRVTKGIREEIYEWNVRW